MRACLRRSHDSVLRTTEPFLFLSGALMKALSLCRQFPGIEGRLVSLFKVRITCNIRNFAVPKRFS